MGAVIELPRDFGARRSHSKASPLEEAYAAAWADYVGSLQAYRAQEAALRAEHAERRVLNASADAVVDNINTLNAALEGASERSAATIAARIADEYEALGAVHDRLDQALQNIESIRRSVRDALEQVVDAANRINDIVGGDYVPLGLPTDSELTGGL